MKKLPLEALLMTILAGAMYYLSPNIEPPWDRTLVLSAVFLGIYKVFKTCCCKHEKRNFSTGGKWQFTLNKNPVFQDQEQRYC